MRRLSACGSCGPIRVSSSAGGAPPTYPATFTKHNLVPGARAEYQMTGPQGDQHRGYWEILAAEAAHRLVFRDGFAHADGTPNTDLPLSTARVRIEEVGHGRTGMWIEIVFPSAEAMEQILAMGTGEGLIHAFSQMDAILAEGIVQHQKLTTNQRERNC